MFPGAITGLLDERGYEYEVLTHEHVHTSADAAKVRGTRLEEAAKALVLHDRTHDAFFLCVVSGHRKLDLKKVKALRESRNVSLAAPEDALRVTGCKVGTVPPFPALLGLRGYADQAVFDNEHVVFSAGTHHDSVRMRAEDWLAASGCRTADIGKL